MSVKPTIFGRKTPYFGVFGLNLVGFGLNLVGFGRFTVFNMFNSVADSTIKVFKNSIGKSS